MHAFTENETGSAESAGWLRAIPQGSEHIVHISWRSEALIPKTTIS